MKTVLLILILCLGFVAIPNRTVSGTSTTIVTGDDNAVIIHTGAAATYTLGTVSDGFSCKIANHGTGNITFSAGITTANGQTITILPQSNGEIVPGQIGNQINIARIGGVWRSI
ncbi:hypothetical protein MCERE19_02251 [Spirosomataceae bacterium]